METWLGCHERAFVWLGGTVKKVVVDNLKSAVIRASLHDPVLGEPYRRLAQHYGFLISPNRPQTPRHKDHASYYTSFGRFDMTVGRRRLSTSFRPCILTG